MSAARPASAPPASGDEARGLLLGLIGVATFSLTLPMTRLAVVDLDPVWIGLARALAASVPAAAWLLWTRAPRPPRELWPRLAMVAGGVIVGFPVFSSVAMRHVDASHGAVVLGVLPLATALAGAVLGGERPSRLYWAFAVAGAAIVCGFALREGAGRLQAGDALLAVAVAAAAVGYAAGAGVAQRLGGPQTICWTLVLSAPVLLPVVAALSWHHGVSARPSAWLGFAYVTLFSQLLGFFAWYKGLAIGGIARVSQVQLLQTFMTLGFAALVGGERPDLATWAFAAAVVAVVAAQRRLA